MISEAEKQFVYCAFRMKMWGEGRGTYHNIDADFADGRLDKQWHEYLASFKEKQDGPRALES